MTSGRKAIYGVGGVLLVAYLATANMPSSDEPAPRARAQASPSPGPEILAVEVRSQASRLQERMAQAPVPDQSSRNPFSFAPAPRAPRAAANVVRAAVAEQAAAVPLAAPPSLTLMGIAEETSPQGVRRTAVIGGEGDTLYMVLEGQAVGDRYKVTKIGADAIELEDLITHGYRRLAIR